MKICTVKECNSKQYCKTYCIKHYNRWKDHGDPLITTRTRNCFSIKEFINTSTKEEILNLLISDNAQWSNACKLYYGDKCSICNWAETTCDVNHIIPKAKGGLNVISNGEVLCPNCHAKKHRRTPIEKRKIITR